VQIEGKAEFTVKNFSACLTNYKGLLKTATACCHDNKNFYCRYRAAGGPVIFGYGCPWFTLHYIKHSAPFVKEIIYSRLPCFALQ
jgi:hypothetical protein